MPPVCARRWPPPLPPEQLAVHTLPIGQNPEPELQSCWPAEREGMALGQPRDEAEVQDAARRKRRIM